MIKNIWNNVFKSEGDPLKKTERLTMKDRLLAYRNLPRFFQLIWATNGWLTFADGIIRLVQSILPLIILQIGKRIIDQVVLITHDSSLPQSTLWKLVVVEFSLIICITILSKLTTLIEDLLAELLTNRTSMMIMSHAATLDLIHFENSAFYDKLERARQQSFGRATLLSLIFSQIQDVITLLSYVTILIAFNPWLILILSISILPSFLGEAYFNSKNYSLIRSQTHGRRELDYLSFIGSSDATAKEVRLYNLAGFFIERFRTISVRFYKAKRKLGIDRSVLGALLNIPGAVGFYISFVYIIKQVLSGRLTLGGLTFLLGTIRQLGTLSQNIAKRFSTIAQGAIYLQDFFNFFEIKPTIGFPVNARPFPNPMKTGFCFENVGFQYLNSGRWANRNLNFTLRPGEKLALVGENGAGKTTLVKLLVRLYDPTEGRILLDGFDLKEYDIDDIRLHMGIIFQDFLRYQLTAAENIAVGNLAEIENEKLIIQSAKQSLAHSIIDKLPGKYQQTLGLNFKNGIELSGGEWQKIALARAYMRNAQIVILDEPTAALDARSEAEVFQRFSEAANQKTAVIISHRFSTVRMADRIMVLEKGEILEIGSHNELLLNNGRYAELFTLQAAGYR
ncbi:ABC transporter ATP-binding protein [Mucilaginibacter sp. UYCu711]|uniref:ABC transporter ATP-binding protein n=1 Tax=Mucilaginibacter sp. UYCu711 TaxID=3156339 RepID=UPI003D1C39E8